MCGFYSVSSTSAINGGVTPCDDRTTTEQRLEEHHPRYSQWDFDTERVTYTKARTNRSCVEGHQVTVTIRVSRLTNIELDKRSIVLYSVWKEIMTRPVMV
ncbi:hypothetical protein PSHT_13855 [Puccinia striiformis]|uniref:Uncharacterized protein n=1 Tax=Puccinia striiformis TaxID=27350 RepID=A0A2S4UNH2_9BASI|nr:hypothetical protein PSHT_13855 [Puccinia striiformis]